jgi:hypothetical protein
VYACKVDEKEKYIRLYLPDNNNRRSGKNVFFSRVFSKE